MRIVLNTEQSYKLSELAKATANDPSDLIYIVKQVDGNDVSFAVDREQFLQGITGGDPTIQDGGAIIGTRPNINFIEGTNVTFSIDDDPTNDRVNITINSSGAVDSVNGQTGVVVLTLENLNDVPVYPNDGDEYVLVENNGVLTWEPYGGSNQGFYVSETFTGTSYNLIHNFGAFPAVQLLDSTNAVVIPLSIVNNTINDLTVTFTTSGTYTVIATIGSPQLPNYTSVSANHTASINGNIIEVTTAGVTVTLPTSNATVTGYEYKIDNSSAGNITVVGQGGETIQGLASQIIPSNSCINVYSNGTNWRIN